MSPAQIGGKSNPGRENSHYIASVLGKIWKINTKL